MDEAPAEPGEADALMQLAARLDALAPPGAPLVAWPSLGLVNFFTGRPNPTHMDYYWPGYVDAEREQQLLRELDAAAPPTIVLCNAADLVFGDGLLWQSAPQLRAYIDRHYLHVSTLGIYDVYVRTSRLLYGAGEHGPPRPPP